MYDIAIVADYDVDVAAAVGDFAIVVASAADAAVAAEAADDDELGSRGWASLQKQEKAKLVDRRFSGVDTHSIV